MKPESKPEVAIGHRVVLQHLIGWEGRTGFVRARKDTGGDLLVELDYEPKLDSEHRKSWRLWVGPDAVAPAPAEKPTGNPLKKDAKKKA